MTSGDLVFGAGPGGVDLTSGELTPGAGSDGGVAAGDGGGAGAGVGADDVVVPSDTSTDGTVWPNVPLPFCETAPSDPEAPSASPSPSSSDDVVSSGPMFDKWSSKADGERANRAISVVEGRSGMVLRTSVSIRWRNSLNERQAPPT